MGKYRDKLQIIADILSIASSGARKTQIMYQANLSYKLLCRYLGEVMDAGLVCCDDEDSYVLTSKGKAFLYKYEEYSQARKHLKAHLDDVKKERILLEDMCICVNTPDSDSPGSDE